uniref:Uncharacterized protein n=1 Tax=Cucumis sativus TaxID=3659 RepID=A0A0A0LDQ4_CUCSA
MLEISRVSSSSPFLRSTMASTSSGIYIVNIIIFTTMFIHFVVFTNVIFSNCHVMDRIQFTNLGWLIYMITAFWEFEHQRFRRTTAFSSLNLDSPYIEREQTETIRVVFDCGSVCHQPYIRQCLHPLSKERHQDSLSTTSLTNFTSYNMEKDILPENVKYSGYKVGVFGAKHFFSQYDSKRCIYQKPDLTSLVLQRCDHYLCLTCQFAVRGRARKDNLGFSDVGLLKSFKNGF